MRSSKPKWSHGEDDTGHLIEHITFVILAGDFLKLALAESVEGKLGETTFTLSPESPSLLKVQEVRPPVYVWRRFLPVRWEDAGMRVTRALYRCHV